MVAFARVDPSIGEPITKAPDVNTSCSEDVNCLHRDEWFSSSKIKTTEYVEGGRGRLKAMHGCEVQVFRDNRHICDQTRFFRMNNFFTHRFPKKNR